MEIDSRARSTGPAELSARNDFDFERSIEREHTLPWRSNPPARQLPVVPSGSTSSGRESVDSLDSLVDPYDDDARTQGPIGSESSVFDAPLPPTSATTLLTPPMSPITSGPMCSPSRKIGRDEVSVTDAAEAGYQRRLLESAQRSRQARERDNASISASHRSYRPQSAVGGEYRSHSLTGKEDPTSNELSRTDGRTAKPLSLVKRDIEFAVMKLVSEKVFRDFMDDPLGRSRFREWLKGTPGGTLAFDSWLDVRAFKRQAEELSAGSLALLDVYLSPEAPASGLPIPHAMKHRLHDALLLISSVDTSLEGPESHLLASLYNHQFQSYIRHKLVETASVRLGKFNLTEAERTGLGDCFCLTNPRLPDHPIVLASAGFEAVTGYTSKQIVGRNCRFLQGPATSPASVQRIRDALERGETTTTLLLNYRKDGTAFYNLLAVIPLRDANGELQYFIGGQVNVTGQLADAGGLSFLVGSEDVGAPPTAAEVSPAMQAYKDAFRSGFEPSPEEIAAAARGRRAAGALDGGALPGSGPMFVAPEKQDARKVSRFFGGLKPKRSVTAPEGGTSQAILGAEGMFSQTGGSVEQQMSVFGDVYQKVVVFRKENRRIIFATEPFLRFVGLPHATPQDKHSSKILHKDILDILVGTGTTKAETAQLRKSLKIAVASGSSLSVACGVRSRTKAFSSAKGNTIAKQGTLHITPMKDQQGIVEAFVAVFG